MAWRFGNYHYVRQGELDNTTPGITRGVIEFAGCDKVKLDLIGDMQHSLSGTRIRFVNSGYAPDHIFEHCHENTSTADEYMRDFLLQQRGEVGDITGDHYLYIEWYAQNGRCVIELDKEAYTILRLRSD